MISRRRVGVNRRQRLNMRASHVPADCLSVKSFVLHEMLGCSIHILTYVTTQMTEEHQHTTSPPYDIPPNTLRDARTHETNNAPRLSRTALYVAP
ncbi:hypothetical protein K443DRAFT_407561 [Laccaria amethystina LaAM-08-1]|uniref:Uncharacterized protein n=1 Tax=Laccaria amethystina LaAM-08-1 TaxID=1095629 RepID=A0A0C9X6G1_9AGAR|nr:hypothetical protein K443DRAFT_407561 [Laccaria amethystina LaAM-08-1]